jgi:hypothetical protein
VDDARRVRRLRVALFVYLFGVAAYFMPGATWSPVSRFALTRAVVERWELQITRHADATGDRARVGDRYFTDKAPVPSFLAVPAYGVFYAAARLQKRFPAYRATGTEQRPAERVIVSPAFRNGLYVCSVSTAALAGALLGLAVHTLARRRVDERSATLAAVATVIATPVLPYAASFFGHTIAAALLLGAFVLLDPLAPARARPRQVMTAGALLGLSVGTEYMVALPAMLLALWASGTAARGRRGQTLGWLAVGALPIAVGLGVYHTVCFGAPWRTGYSFVVHPAFAPGHATGFLGITTPRPEVVAELLVGPARGLWYVSPLCFVALIGGLVGWRERRDPALPVAALLFGVLLLINASYYQWDGGWATGPRHLVPSLGLLGLGIAYAFAHGRLHLFAAVAGGLSATVLLLTTAVALEAPPDKNAITEYLVPMIREGKIARVSGASNLGLLFGLGRRASLVPLLFWVVAGAAALVALASPRTRDGAGSGRPVE